MNILDALYTITIRPLEILFEVIFYFANRIMDNPGLSIIVLSLAVNFLVLPLYIRADALQKEEKDTEENLKYWVDHIKKTFKGDERFMMLQAYYRLKDYKSVYMFKGTLSLLLQIPFFMAAYRFLANLKILQGFSFGPINDLGAPDAILKVFGISINILPILMTLINIISSIVYTKGAPVKAKLQAYITALVFLFFLYGAPSGLAFYWTLNNVFSLVKNLFYKLKDPLRAITTGSLLRVPAIKRYMQKRTGRDEEENAAGSTNVFLLAALYISFLIGGLVPSAVISSSTSEFVDPAYLNNPLIYILYSLCISCGFFAVWLGVFYGLLSNKGRKSFARVMWIASVIFTVDYFFFGTHFGNLSPYLQYDTAPVYELKEIIINSLVIISVIVITYVLYRKTPKLVVALITSLSVLSVALTVNNVRNIRNDYDHIKEIRSASADDDKNTLIRLSRTGKNVVILMMDRMMGYFVPYIMEEDKTLYESFDGFKFYPNTVSFGTSTNAGLPGLMGGYEYIPQETNKNNSKLLKDKHNEALKLMPALFDDNSYDVTVIDPAYADYEDFTNLSIFDDYPHIHKYALSESISVNENIETFNLYRNFFCYGLFRAVPAFLQSTLYDNGNYSALERTGEVSSYSIQVCESNEFAYGLDSIYRRAFGALQSLTDMTYLEDNEIGAVLIMNNLTPHAPTLLQLPDYTQEELVDNTALGESQFKKHDGAGRELILKDLTDVQHYHVNMSSMKELGKWMDHLREEGVYDNTKIIIVSDHAYSLDPFDEMMIEGAGISDTDRTMDCSWFNCILMVKDFNASGFSVDDTFMTNADVPTLAMKNMIDNPVNPFTGKRIDNSYKNEEELKLMVTRNWQVSENNGYVFTPAPYYTVKDNIFKKENWKYLGIF